MPLNRDEITRLIELEADLQGVDPRLAVAVAMQESNLRPDNPGDNGRSRGVFHLQERAAIDAGIDPRQRDDTALGIFAGVKYLKQQLDKSGGHIPSALSRYNRGTPEYRGIGDPDYVYHVMRHYPDHPLGKAPEDQDAYRKRLNKTFGAGTAGPAAAEKPGLIARVGKALSPASAEAAGLSPAERQRLEELEASLAEPTSPPQAQAPSPPTARSTPEQDAAYRASRGQQEPVTSNTTTPTPPTQPGASQGPPTPSPDPSPTPGMRFQALPSITQLELADRMQKTKLFESLQPAMQEEFLRSEEPQAGGLAVGGGPVAQSQPVTDPAAALAMGRRAPGWREGDPLPPEARRPPTPTEAPVTEGITAPSTMIPLLMPGAGIKAVTPLLRQAGPLTTRGARAAAEGLSQTAGWTAGRTAETGQVPSPGEIGTEAALNVATGGIVEIPSALRAAKNAVLRATPGAQILLNQRAVQEAEGLGKRVFNAQDKEVVGKAFDAVVATGEKLDTSPVRTLWQSLTPAEQRIAGNELSKISSTFADALKTKKLGDWDIGDLQHLRSELRVASQSKRTPETIDLLQSMRSAVDDAIANGMAKGSLPAAELIAAQKAYRKVMQAEDLQGLITKHTKDSPNLKWQELNLAAFNKELRGGGKKKVAELVQGMDATERQVLMQELDSLKRHYPFVRVNRLGTAVTGVGGSIVGGAIGGPVGAVVPLILSAAVSSPRVMSMFKRSIIEGKGRLAQHHVDALLNAIRHESQLPRAKASGLLAGIPPANRQGG